MLEFTRIFSLNMCASIPIVYIGMLLYALFFSLIQKCIPSTLIWLLYFTEKLGRPCVLLIVSFYRF